MRGLNVAIGVVCAAGACAFGQTYNAATEFSPTTNPNGVWSYGLRPGSGGTFASLTHTAVIDQINFWDRDLPFPESYPKIGHNGTASTQFWGGPDGPVAAGELVMHPGALGAVLRFTAPVSAVYTVFVQARATASCSSATHVSVWAGGTQLDGAGLGGFGSQWLATRSAYRGVGGTIDVVVADGGNGINCDHVAMWAVITAGSCGAADIGGQGGVPGFDGLLDNNDFVVFVDRFFSHHAEADRGRTGGVPGSDGAFDNNDFVVFIDQFFAGCD